MTSKGPSFVGMFARRTWPIYILSSHRAGSTLLRYLLDAHERLACPPETKFVAGIEPFLEYPQATRALTAMGITEADVLLEVRLLVERIMRRYVNQHHKARWVDKTPNYYRCTHLIERIFQRQVLYVVLARHPLDCISSLEIFERLTIHSADPEIARIAQVHGYGRYAWARYWDDVYSRLGAFSASLPERAIIVRYEDLVARTDATLARVLNFLGESHDPGIVTRAFSMEHTGGFGDSKIARTDAVHSYSVGRWRTWPRAETVALWEYVRNPATILGYDIDATIENVAG